MYLDTDTLVLRDIYHLYNCNIDNKVLIGVQEYSSPFVYQTKRITGLVEIVDFPDERFYYNTGVLLVNLDRWRHTSVTRRSINLLLNHYDRLTVDDQDALNGVVLEDWGTLDPCWNVQTHCVTAEGKTIHYNDLVGRPTHEDLFDAPFILHFNHHPKPVDLTYRGPFLALYNWYEERSGYFSPASFRFRRILRYGAPTLASGASVFKKFVRRTINITRPYRHRLARQLPRSLQRLLNRDVD